MNAVVSTKEDTMAIVGAFDLHRRQITFDLLDIATGELHRGRIAQADRQHLRSWLTDLAADSGGSAAGLVDSVID
jgi:hypothetical protein